MQVWAKQIKKKDMSIEKTYLDIIKNTEYDLNSKAAYIEVFREIYIPIINDYHQKNTPIPKDMQAALFSQICNRVASNLDAKNKELFNHEEIHDLFQLFHTVLSDVEDDVIISYRGSSCNPSYIIRNFLLYLKYQNSSLPLKRSY